MAAGIGRSDPRDRRLSTRFAHAALLIVALAVTGCGTRPDDAGPARARPARRELTPAERDSVRLVDEERAGARRDSALAAHVRPLLEDWEEAWSRVIPGFRLDSVRWQKRDTLAPVSSGALAATALDSLTQRRWNLTFTSDRWVAVDPDFGRVFAASGRLEARELPRVSVYDFRARRSLVLATSAVEGRPFSVAGWTGDRRLVVAGWQPWDGEAAQIRPAVWIYDLDSRHRTTGMGPPVSEPELEAHEAMLELLIRERSAPARRR